MESSGVEDALLVIADTVGVHPDVEASQVAAQRDPRGGAAAAARHHDVREPLPATLHLLCELLHKVQIAPAAQRIRSDRAKEGTEEGVSSGAAIGRRSGMRSGIRSGRGDVT